MTMIDETLVHESEPIEAARPEERRSVLPPARRGRPPVHVDVGKLLELRQAGRSLSQIAVALHVSRATVWKRLETLPEMAQEPAIKSEESVSGEGR